MQYNSPDNSPDEASPGELARPPESIGQMLPKQSLSCSVCNFDFKMSNDSDSDIIND